ncbi:MAG TPA: choice-of-anchor R domain-containing protein [Verrucomicrobiae bacterium]|jgi:hypothetical protein
MKLKISIIGLVVGLLAPQVVQSQGTLYLSNLSDPSSGSAAVGDNSWLAVGFYTGNNTGGYVVDSVQLAMTDATGSPNDFTVMLYSESPNLPPVVPGNSLGILDGSANPSTAGLYTYTPAANLVLSPSTFYFIVLTAGTAVANGAYGWSESASSPVSNGDWGGGFVPDSSDGLHWLSDLDAYTQFAINATAVPEPSTFALGGLAFGLITLARFKKQQRT